MNNGKICISVCAETADELIEQINRAEDLADVIEIRFDCLNKLELDNAIEQIIDLDCLVPFLITFRPKNEGGARDLLTDERNKFWKMKKLHFAEILDYEWEMLSKRWVSRRFFEYSENSKVICSFHHFQNHIKTFESLAKIYDEILTIKIRFNLDQIPTREIDIIKIAVQTEDITDSIAVWKLLEKAKSDNKRIIPIAMGESGKWTRILGLAHGAFMTYAALDSGKETAPGQVSAKDLTEVYRAKELDENTEVYGILGNNTSVSMSPYIHNAAFKFHNLNSVFVPLQVHDLDEFIKRMVKPETREIDLNFKGFSVTIPHKQNIIKHLDFIDESAKKIGAVNTVKIVDGKLHGYNTDANGFIEPLKNTYGDLKNVNVAIIGAGGAARACIYALKNEGAIVTIFARDLEKAKTLAEDFEVDLQKLPKTKDQRPKTDFKEFEILVNTTPLGMKGKFDGETPAFAEQLEGLNLVYDLIYIPFQTPLMEAADKAEVPKIGGLAMLIAQAMEQQKIWTGMDAPMKEMSRAALEKLK